jgi:hypothetical protein
VTITGTNFGAAQGTSTVTFNGTAAAPTKWSNTSIETKDPAGATPGNIVVTVGGFASAGTAFTVGPPPAITTLTPNSGPVDTPVTIAGTNFGATQGTSTVKFNGTAATAASKWSDTSIEVKVPAGATTGDVVVTVGESASAGSTFTVAPLPTIKKLTPDAGAVDTPVTIAGTNFGAAQGTSTVKFNGTAATAASKWSDTSIEVKVPAGATTGDVVVTVGELASVGSAFTVGPLPTIKKLTPNFGPVDTSVTIAGTNFGATQGTSTVKFNGTAATTASKWSDTSIEVKVPAKAKTGNVVVTVSGVASKGVRFTVGTPPALRNLTPDAGAVDTPVTIAGTNFGANQGTSTVKFNGTAATVTKWSDTSIEVKVPATATTGNVVVAVGGLASKGVAFSVRP